IVDVYESSNGKNSASGPEAEAARPLGLQSSSTP
ncbi:hypothetical protein AVEN_67591-1, partial [Araneus ventricosus]